VKSTCFAVAAASFLLLGALPARADAIPYPDAGTVASTNSFIATGASINIYLYGHSAADIDQLEVVDLTNGTNSGFIITNDATAVGTKFVFSGLTAGDHLEFLLNNVTLGQFFSSIPSNSADGVNHAYATAYSNDGSAGDIAAIPVAGTFVGFEDLPVSGADFDYNDLQFVFSDVASSTSTPEPSSVFLLGAGLAVFFAAKKMRG